MNLSFGERVRNLREDADINQTQLGLAINMTQRKISYIECGKTEPSIDDIIAFCRFFKSLPTICWEYQTSIQKNNAPKSFGALFFCFVN